MNLKPLLIVPPIALAVLGFTWLTRPDQTPPAPPEESRLAVRVAGVAPHPVAATAIGYGRVEPMRDWSAIAEVEGRILTLAPGLAVGSIVEAGTVLVEIDRTDSEIARQKAEANIAAVEAELVEMTRAEENTRRSLEVEDRILSVAQAEHDRVSSLVDRGASTQATLDAAQKVLLGQTTAVTNLRNTLDLYPAKRQSLEATLAVRRAELADAARALEKSTITAPFRGRVAVMEAEVGQFVRTGEMLLTLEDTQAVEITAEIQPLRFAPLMKNALGARPGDDVAIDLSEAIDLLHAAGITAEVSMSLAGMNPVWPAEIMRLRGTLDDSTGTVGVVVRVENPTVGQRDILRPPLNVGAFVTVTFRSPPLDGTLTVPRGALRYTDDGTPFVYIADGENRLDRRLIQVGQVVGDAVIVFSGLDGSETLVLSDPHPPVLGMALDPVPVTTPPGDG